MTGVAPVISSPLPMYVQACRVGSSDGMRGTEAVVGTVCSDCCVSGYSSVACWAKEEPPGRRVLDITFDLRETSAS